MVVGIFRGKSVGAFGIGIVRKTKVCVNLVSGQQHIEVCNAHFIAYVFYCSWRALGSCTGTSDWMLGLDLSMSRPRAIIQD